jgi:hypothetical protein
MTMPVARRARAVSRFESRLARGAASEVVAKSGRRRHPGAPDLDPTPTRRTVHPDTGTRVTGQVESPHPAATLPADIADALREGRLSQRCPACGTVEAAGFYCTRCYRPAGPEEWFRQERGRPASEPQKPPENGIKRGPGRPRAHLGAGAPVTDPAAGFWPA